MAIRHGYIVELTASPKSSTDNPPCPNRWAWRSSRVNESIGDAARFSAVAAEYAKAPEVTSDRLYIEAMEQILPKIRKLIVGPNGNLDLSIIRRGEAPISSPTGR